MRIVTLNTWKNEGDYCRRLPLMRDGLASLRPDAVCLQECFVAQGFNTAAWLAAELSFDLYPAPARAKPRPHEGRDLFSTSGLAILARVQGDAATYALSSDPDDGERIAQRLDLIVDQRPLRILNLHLTHLRSAAKLRATQLKESLDWAGENLAGGLILMGDLNATAADLELQPLGLEPQSPTIHGARIDSWPTQTMAVDHCVLLRRGEWLEKRRLRGCDVPDPEGWFASDHTAVGLELEKRRCA